MPNFMVRQAETSFFSGCVPDQCSAEMQRQKNCMETDSGQTQPCPPHLYLYPVLLATRSSKYTIYKRRE